MRETAHVLSAGENEKEAQKYITYRRIDEVLAGGFHINKGWLLSLPTLMG